MFGNTDLAIARTMQDYCDARDRVLGLIRHAMKAIHDAALLCEQHVTYGFPYDAKPRASFEEARQHLDGRFWQFTLDRTGLTRLMDAEALAHFKRELDDGKAPEFTMENIQTQVLSMHQTADAMFARGVYNVFRQIKRGHYRTNEREPFEIGRKNILTGWFEPNWLRPGLHVSHWRADLINDVDRIVSVFSGRPYTARRLESALNGAFEDGTTSTYEDEQLRIRGFRNGNAHLTFRAPRTLEKINRTIAAYCGGSAIVDVKDKLYGAGQS